MWLNVLNILIYMYVTLKTKVTLCIKYYFFIILLQFERNPNSQSVPISYVDGFSVHIITSSEIVLSI